MALVIASLVAVGIAGGTAGGTEPGQPGTSSSDGVTTVSECVEITEPGRYRLTDDVVNSTRDYCITIYASDVVLDGGGHRVDGVDRHDIDPDDDEEAATKGIRVRHGKDGRITNVTVKNVVMTDWGQGMFVGRTEGGRFVNNTGRSNGAYGIYLGFGANDNTVAGNRVVNNLDEGIGVAHHADGNVIRNTYAAGNALGIATWDVNGTHVVENVVTGNDVGIAVAGGDDSVVRDNSVTQNRIGIRASTTENTAIVDNVVRDNEKFGVFVTEHNTDSVIRDNEISGSTQGIRLARSRGNRIADNAITDNRIGALVREAGGNTLQGNRWNNTEWDINSLRLSTPITVENASIGAGTRVSFRGRNVAARGAATAPGALPEGTRVVGAHLKVWPESGPSWIDFAVRYDPGTVEDPSSLDLWVYDGTWRRVPQGSVDRGPDSLATNVTDLDGVTYFVVATTGEPTPSPTDTASPTTSPATTDTPPPTSPSPATTATPPPTTGAPTPGFGMGVSIVALFAVWSIRRRYR